VEDWTKRLLKKDRETIYTPTRSFLRNFSFPNNALLKKKL
jgi:hypothetical protein